MIWHACARGRISESVRRPVHRRSVFPREGCMSRDKTLCSILVAVIVVAAAAAYVFTAPYERFPGVVIGGEPTPTPADWNTVNDHGVVFLKLAGVPPFVIRIVYSTDDGGIITATRPDGGYWAGRVRGGRRDGWIRLGDATYALTATEIVGDERIPYLENYGAKNGMRMGYDFDGEIVPSVNEPLHTWEVFYWTPR